MTTKTKGKTEGTCWREVIRSYRVILFTDGEERYREDEKTGRVAVAKRGVSRTEAEEVKRAKGQLSLAELLAHKVRYFIDGGVIGSRGFVDELFEARREYFGLRRRSGARKIRESEAPLYSLRDLKVGAVE